MSSTGSSSCLVKSRIAHAFLTCYVDCADEADEEWDVVGGQLGPDPVEVTLQVELARLLHNGGHARLALHTRHVHPVDHAVRLLQHRADHALHLHHGHVLATPSEQNNFIFSLSCSIHLLLFVESCMVHPEKITVIFHNCINQLPVKYW